MPIMARLLLNRPYDSSVPQTMAQIIGSRVRREGAAAGIGEVGLEPERAVLHLAERPDRHLATVAGGAARGEEQCDEIDGDDREALDAPGCRSRSVMPACGWR